MTFSKSEAVAIARGQNAEDVAIDESRCIELVNGWFFPFRPASGAVVAGSNGVIVNKESGSLFRLGSAFPIDRDLRMYELGYCFDRYDLVILSVENEDAALDTLEELRMSVVVPEYDHGSVWRIPRDLSRTELRQRLAALPCVFDSIGLYFGCESLESARERDLMKFEIHKAPRGRSS